MKGMRGVAAMLVMVAVLYAPRADAQTVQLGWNSAMTMACQNASCSSILFVLSVGGLLPTDNNGNAVPGPVLALNPSGFPQSFNILITGGPGVFTSAAVTSPNPAQWLTFNFTGSTFSVQTVSPLNAGPVSVLASMSVGGAYGFSYSGFAYIDPNLSCFDATGTPINCSTTGQPLYQQGDFNGNVAVIPEPMSMTLLAMGLVGLGLASYRRRKKRAD